MIAEPSVAAEDAAGGRGFSLADRSVYVLDPMTDPRWAELLSRHPRASVFHSRAWLGALKRTYGYEPFVLTTTESGPLQNGLAVCRVRTWAARRLVSLPFSDHCDPLVDDRGVLSSMVKYSVAEMRRGGSRSLELRPRATWIGQGFGVAEGKADTAPGQGFRLAPSTRYCLHTLDLTRPLAQIFAGFHPSSTQRAIRRAEREALTYEAGRSGRLLASFYYLLRLTRRRHGLPPQPFAWFRNVLESSWDPASAGLNIHLASKDGRPVAAVLTLSFKKALVYKYGGSDARYHHLGAMPFLFWRVIQEAKARGVEELDLGRSDLDQPGLLAFKDHLGAGRSTLTYYRWPERATPRLRGGSAAEAARRVIAYLPNTALDLTGRLLYKHLG